MANYNREAVILRQRTAKAGRKWVIFGDEQSQASHGVVPDANDPAHDIPRKQGLWGNLMGGGAGVEWYFGHQYPHMDINCEDWRSRNVMWDQTRYALEFFHKHLPFREMGPDNSLVSAEKAYCLAKPGQVYAIYLLEGGSTDINVASGIYSVQWYNPRTGGELLRGDIRRITGPGAQSIGQPPKESDKDWAVLVRKTTRRR